MDPQSFRCEAAGRPRRAGPVGASFWTFLPAAPPLDLELPPDLVRLLSEADAALSELSGLGRYLPNPDLLQRIRTDGDWIGWLRYFLTAVRESASLARSQGDALLTLRAEYLTRLGGKHWAAALLDKLFVNPFVTISRAAEMLAASPPTARKSIAELEKIGLLNEQTGRGWGQRWGAVPILDAIRGGTR